MYLPYDLEAQIKSLEILGISPDTTKISQLKILTNSFRYPAQQSQQLRNFIQGKLQEFAPVFSLLIDPVEGFLVDSQGRRLGYSAATGPVTEIPDSVWFGGADGIGWIYSELEGPLTLELSGLGEDYYVNLKGYQGQQQILFESEGFLGREETISLPVEFIDLIPHEILGTPENDIITGSIHPDIVVALSGDDSITGNTGDDTLYGNAGNDSINGGSGNDVIEPGTGVDEITLGIGTDEIRGRLQELNGDFVEDFTSSDKIIVLGEAFYSLDVSNAGNNVSQLTFGSVSIDLRG
ncbi:MAG: calcium-binding protein [Moorea sp. SIO2I5]|nr:calcium-binding protein [Moorena sp. SIO2I5]